LSGTVASAQISGSYNNAVSFTNGGNIFSGKFTGNGAGLTNLSVTVTNLPAGILTNNSSSVVLNGTFSGNGTGLTNLNASQLSSGVISYAVLPGFQGNFATISGGSQNFGGGFASTVAGGQLNATIYDFGSIGGGYANQDYGYYATIGGGQSNSISGDKATIGGGYHNTAAYLSTVGGGANNNAGIAATVGGGAGNNAGAPSSTVCGGTNNTASALSSTVAGGANNQSLGQYSATVGGNDNIATGDFTFAGGNHARAPYQGDFVWADDNGGNFAATANNQFFVRAGGGVFFYYGSGSTGVQLASGSGSWSSLSDRNAKENFQTVDAQTVLTAVATMPMTTWNYKTQAKSIRHVGPMAQDFAAAFNVGENNTTISTVDEGGVALAAIQGLNQKLEAEKAENAKLKSRLEALEQLVTEKLGGAK
jgi:hypothetical protein